MEEGKSTVIKCNRKVTPVSLTWHFRLVNFCGPVLSWRERLIQVFKPSDPLNSPIAILCDSETARTKPKMKEEKNRSYGKISKNRFINLTMES